MANKTLIRSTKKHEVKLAEGTQLAQSQHAPTSDEPPVPPLIRKAPRARRSAEPEAPPPTSAAPAKAPSTRRKAEAADARRTATPAPRKRSSAVAADPKTTRPRLPARVPADGLWESDSNIMQRLQALVQRNGQLSEQLQRLQSPPLSKGYKP